MEIELTIDALVLNGFRAVDPGHLAVALETELARLFLEQGTGAVTGRDAAKGATYAALNCSLALPADARVETVATEVAHIVFDRLYSRD